MRVFVFEYMTGGGAAGGSMVASLTAEGDMMLAAVVADLLAVEDVQVSICRDARLDALALPVHVEWVDHDWRDSWQRCLSYADAVLPIAPETDGILESLCKEVEDAGKVLLNSGWQAVAVAGSKLETFRRLRDAGVPVIESWEAHVAPSLGMDTMVVKPDRGVGCHGIHLMTGERALVDFLAKQQPSSKWLVQPYVPGVPASLSLMISDDCLCLLGTNRQRVAQVDDGFMLLGCVVNGLAAAAPELLPLARHLSAVLPGLWGYVGVDLVLTEDGPMVIEVNPRLTTSYVGLSRSIGRNVAALILQLADDPAALPAPQLTGKSVHVDLEMNRVA